MNSHEASVILEVQRSQFDLAGNEEGKHLPHLTAAPTGQLEGNQRWPDMTEESVSDLTGYFLKEKLHSGFKCVPLF